MKNGNNLNSTPDTGKSFEEAYGAWDTLQEELAQQKQAKAEAEAAKSAKKNLQRVQKDTRKLFVMRSIKAIKPLLMRWLNVTSIIVRWRMVKIK